MWCNPGAEYFIDSDLLNYKRLVYSNTYQNVNTNNTMTKAQIMI